MARVRILKRQEKAYIELPPEMASSEEVEIFPLRDGYYLLSVPLGGERKAPGQKAGELISERERYVLRKLLSIRFENRVPAYVNKALSGEDLQVLKELERRGLVNVFRGKKYTEGVYNIKDSIYPLLSQKPVTSERDAQPAPPPPAQGSSGYIGQLNSRGFVVVQDKKDAFMLSEVLNGRMKSGDVVGVKGFDNKFYIVTRNYFSAASAKVGQALKDDMDHGSIAAAANLDPEGCMAVLRLMAENGEIIEKKKGIFAPV
ncbi:MAG: hypothetical protein AB1324_01705 [Candidatus Micrarchaeota archaeon]